MKIGIVHILIFIMLIHVSNSEPSVSENASKDNSTDVLETWRKMDKKLLDTVKSLMKKMMPMFLKASERMNLTSQCSNDVFQLISGLKSLKKWAFSFVDSSAKLTDGILSRSLSNFGAYDQCIETVVPDKKEGSRFRGQYCRVDFRLPLPRKRRGYLVFDQLEELQNFTGTEYLMDLSKSMHLMYYFPLSFGLCIPSRCTENDLSQMLEIVIEDFYMTANVKHCEVLNPKPELKGVQIFAIFCCVLLACLVLAGTSIEIYYGSVPQRKQFRYLKCFSAKHNFKKVANTKTSSKELRCLHGIRFLSITWVCFGHAYFYPGWYMANYQTLKRAQKISTEPFAQVIINSSMVVDTFLFMSGLLVSYLTIKHVIMDSKKLNVPQYIFHRFWRLCPLYYFTLLCIFLVPLTGSGPIFKEIMDQSITPCFNHGWKNFIFINNFYDIKESCMVHNWYVACDVQLYLVSLLVFFAYFKSEKLGIGINIFIILFSIFYAGIITHFVLPVFSVLMIYRDMDDISLGNKILYGNPITRGGPYFIGVLVGYILVTKPNLKLSKITEIFGWCLATVSSLAVIYCTAYWFNVHFPMEYELVLYSSFYNVAFTSSVAWMTFCCIKGRGGFVNQILSWKGWVPFSKLTFGMYLTESVFQTAFISNFRSAQEYSHLHFIVQAFGFMCISALLSLLLSLLVEAPFMELEKLIFRRNSEKVSKDSKTDKDISLSNGKNTQPSDTYASYHVSLDNHAFNGKE